MSRDSTAIEGREKPQYIKKSKEEIESAELNDQELENSLNSERLPLKNPSKNKPKKKRGGGGPKKEEEVEIKDLSRIQKQAGGMSLEEMIKDLRVLSNKGAKKIANVLLKFGRATNYTLIQQTMGFRSQLL